jgi:ribose 5-phosphate isomerase B
MKLVIGADSAGHPLLEVIAKHLASKPDLQVTDFSVPKESAPEFYAHTAERAAKAIVDGSFDRGILFCGTGIGVSISANKVPGIRAALTHDTYSAERAAKSNNAQIITLGARVVGPELAKAIIDTWLASDFDPKGSSAANVAAIDGLDDKYSKPAA